MSDRLVIGQGNEAQADAWGGEEGDRWVTYADFYDNSSRPHHDRLLSKAAIQPTDHVLDIGCGNGRTSRDAARRAAEGRVLGIDLSWQMLERARMLAAQEGLTNVEFVNADAQVHPFEPASFDVAMSKFGTMFFADQVAAFSNIARALRPDGRLALCSWQEVSGIEFMSAIADALTLGAPRPAPPPDAPTPFRHADPEYVRGVLRSAGFRDVEIEPFTDPVTVHTTVDDAFDVLMGIFGWMTAEHSADDLAQAQANLRASLEAHQTPDGIAYGSAAWLITAHR
jgi:SAM-dependent methyltransferase